LPGDGRFRVECLPPYALGPNRSYTEYGNLASFIPEDARDLKLELEYSGGDVVKLTHYMNIPFGGVPDMVEMIPDLQTTVNGIPYYRIYRDMTLRGLDPDTDPTMVTWKLKLNLANPSADDKKVLLDDWARRHPEEPPPPPAAQPSDFEHDDTPKVGPGWIADHLSKNKDSFVGRARCVCPRVFCVMRFLRAAVPVAPGAIRMHGDGVFPWPCPSPCWRLNMASFVGRARCVCPRVFCVMRFLRAAVPVAPEAIRMHGDGRVPSRWIGTASFRGHAKAPTSQLPLNHGEARPVN